MDVRLFSSFPPHGLYLGSFAGLKVSIYSSLGSYMFTEYGILCGPVGPYTVEDLVVFASYSCTYSNPTAHKHVLGTSSFSYNYGVGLV
jgi:hypothetical protein